MPNMNRPRPNNLKNNQFAKFRIVLSTESLIGDDGISLRPPLIVEFMGYADEWDTPTKPSD